MDATDLLEMERRLTETVRELERHVNAVAMARQVKEFAGDMRKAALAKYVAPYLRAGETATAAETLARADFKYQEELAALAEQYGRAERHIAGWDAMHAKLDALRSSLSLAKEQIKL